LSSSTAALGQHRRRRSARRREHVQGKRQHDIGSPTASCPWCSFWWRLRSSSRGHDGAPELHGVTRKTSSMWRAASSSVLGEASSSWSAAAARTRRRGRLQLLVVVVVLRSGSGAYGQWHGSAAWIGG
jgi:hypothetical protein